jgi:glycosyltransferase involved in cell wall biosynthesis
MTLALAKRCIALGHRVDLVVLRDRGPLADSLPPDLRRVPLARRGSFRRRLLPLRADPLGAAALARPVLLARHTDWQLAYLASLRDYLAHERPDGLLTGTPRLNILAVLARRLARVPTRLLLSERTAPSHDGIGSDPLWRKRHLPALMRRSYAEADAVIAVSNGVAQDLAILTGLSAKQITTIYNPVVGPELATLAAAPVAHPWLEESGPPVILGAGRLTDQKDFPTLVRAFARLRASRPARLIILGNAGRPVLTAERMEALTSLAKSLGVEADLDLPGYVENPVAWMAKASLFVLSSAWEGFGNVLVEAMACGCPVVSTNSPSGPAEILDGGRYGRLVPVGDDEALAEAMAATLDAPPSPALLRGRAGEFTVERAADAYLAALFGRG